MHLEKIEVSNFKAVESTSIELDPEFNVLVGSNGAGKSSILQALHWVLQSASNSEVDTNREGKASTLSERYAIYMPSPDYNSAGHSTEYGNTRDKPQLDLKVYASIDGSRVEANMWLKSARNEGVSVHVPSGNPFTNIVRADREISAYIPGIAGIPLSEEKRSSFVVRRLAAAGDSNTVLRNILVLLKHRGDSSDLDRVEQLVSRVMGDFRLQIKFDEDTQTHISAKFQTGQMRSDDTNLFRPLELAGNGYLQVLQIFAYLVYFKPRLLLVDEPDAHLFTTAQERLVGVLADAAKELDCQVILSTHSPAVVRNLPPSARLIWMSDGRVVEEDEGSIRNLMGWGLLDKKVLLMSEDSDVSMLASIIGQWADIERSVAIWPMSGSSTLPKVEILEGLKAILGDSVKMCLHRDGDFIVESERMHISEPFERGGFKLWFTKYSDMESYWCNPEAIAAHFDVTYEEGERILESAIVKASQGTRSISDLRKKRNDFNSKENRKGDLPAVGEEDVIAEYQQDGMQYSILGKTLVSAIRSAAQDRNLPHHTSFGNAVPVSLRGKMALDLRDTLRALIAP